MVQIGNVTIEKVGDPVPMVVLGGRSSLSKEGAAEVTRLMRRQPVRFTLRLILTWGLIGGAIALALAANHWAVSVLAVVFIGTRQNVLGLLMHEQVHKTAFRSQWGDYLTNLFVTYPLGLTLEGYRRVHLNHHQHFFTDRDPDFVRKQGREWTFPQRPRQFLWNLVRDALGINLWKAYRSKTMEEQEASRNRRHVGTPWWLRPVYYASALGAITYFGVWMPFLLYWVLPWATVLQAVVRWAAVCEHKYNLARPEVAEATPFIHLRWWEQLLLPNLYFTTFHVYHHYYPKVPWNRLPEVHAIFVREGLVNEENIFHGFASYLRYLFTGEGPARRGRPAAR